MAIFISFQWAIEKLGLKASNSKKLGASFVDLAPTSVADEEGIYFEALTFATNNPDVSNIALTGPYGSGKSSVIKSFLQRYPGNPLPLSLAAFLPEAESIGEDSEIANAKGCSTKSKISKQEIERSILQQMLYGADANKLPLSRFKRIQSPKWWACVTSLLIVLGIISIWYLFQKRAEVISGDFFTPLDPTNWFNLAVFTYGFIFVWRSLHQLYLKSFGLSLKAISLKDIEITPEVAEEESILNRHLDEIIYFFQSTSYDLVIVEDLDRFDNPEVFVTLREINGLINANAGVRQKVRFLYALRDDMFANTDRTKFFEFIVPIVPIINHSNSIDKVLEQGQRLSLNDRLAPQFLREVSRYLIDLRLIRNIFNEYVIYVANLLIDGEETLDPNKLLAVLIYKNVLPRDFEELHQQKGALANLLSRYDEFIRNAEANYRNEISEIETQMEAAKKQLPKDVGELRKIYAMALIEKLPAGHGYVRLRNSTVSYSQLPEHAEFEGIFGEKPIQSAAQPNGGWSQTKVSDLESVVDPNRTYTQRKEDIERKSAKHIVQSVQKVRNAKAKITALRTQKFNEILKANREQAESCFDTLGDRAELMKFLVFEGFLDDTYYQYTSLFHSGRLSPNDNKFLIQIRSFSTPNPDFQIDNPAEVVSAMRDEDFGQSYILNRHLLDYLLGNEATQELRVASAIGFISSNFDRCDNFLLSYYERGAQVRALVSALVTQRPNFAFEALESARSVAHTARLIAYAPDEILTKPPFSGGDVSAFFSSFAAEILSEGVEFDLLRLKSLQVEVAELSSVDEFPDVLEFLVDNSLYAVSKDNLHRIFVHFGESNVLRDLEKKHYTTVLNSQNESLITRVESDFTRYVRHVLLQTESNTEEEEQAILAALNHEEVATEFLEEFWAMQSNALPILAEIPSRFHLVALDRRLILASWENCLTFQSSESYIPEVLTNYLADNDNRKALAQEPVPDRADAYELRKFLIENDAFDDNTYQSYVGALPKKFKDFPASIGYAKLKILVETDAITFSPSSFNHLEHHRDLQVAFAARNFSEFSRESQNISIDNDFRMDLLGAEISEDNKCAVIRDLEPASISGDPSRAEILSAILESFTIEIEELGFELIRAVVTNSNPTSRQISLLNKCHKLLSPKEVRTVLGELPEPYCEIATFGKSPRIEDTPINRLFVAWLKERRIISSSKNTALGRSIRINTFRRPRTKPSK